MMPRPSVEQYEEFCMTRNAHIYDAIRGAIPCSEHEMAETVRSAFRHVDAMNAAFVAVFGISPDDDALHVALYGGPNESHHPAMEEEDIGPPLVRLLTPEEQAARIAEQQAHAERFRAADQERRERIKGKPHVYFIQQGDSGAIKIGCSKNPTQRLQGLQTGHSEALRLLTCAVGSQAQERALHDRFAHLRVSGEWFRPAEDLLAYIRLVNDRRAL